MKVKVLKEMLSQCNPEADVMLFDDGNYVEAFTVCESTDEKIIAIVDINVYENCLEEEEDEN